MDNNNFKAYETKNDDNKTPKSGDIINSIKALLILRKVFSFILEKKKLDIII